MFLIDYHDNMDLQSNYYLKDQDGQWKGHWLETLIMNKVLHVLFETILNYQLEMV
jgi:hypothetical protein